MKDLRHVRVGKKKILRLGLIFFLCTFSNITLSAQQLPPITGKLIDSKSHAPVPFATIRIRTGQGLYGVVSNNDGDFQIPARYRVVADTITISCIGYASRSIPLNRLNDNEVNVIELNESVTQLSEVMIQASRTGRITAYRVVAAAIENIPRNYPTSDHSYIGYYRDYQLRNSEYVNLNEGIVGIFDKGFNTDDQRTTNISLYNYRRNMSFPRDSVIEVAYDTSGKKFIPGAYVWSFGGNELSILRIHDAIRNNKAFSYSFVNVFKNEFLLNHFFRMQPSVFLNKVPLYHVSFKAKSKFTGPDHAAIGDIYIEYGSFSIHKLTYSVYNEHRLLYSIDVEYSKQDLLMRLNYLSVNNFFKARDPLDFEVADVLFDRDLNAFVIEFNRPPERKSALNDQNYRLTIDDTRLDVERLEILQEDDKKVYVYISATVPVKIGADGFARRLKANVKNVKDMQGRTVNRPTYIEVNQFRELFVQQTSEDSAVEGGSYIDKNVPLSTAKISTDINLGNYWMNTPLKRE